MRKGSNQQNCGSIVGCYESVGLSTVQNNVFLAELIFTRQLLGFVVSRTLSLFRHTIKDDGKGAGKVCDTEGNAWETTEVGPRKENNTYKLKSKQHVYKAT